MEGRLYGRIIAVSAVLLLLWESTGSAIRLTSAGQWGKMREATIQAREACQGKFKGRRPSLEELEQVLSDHRDWYGAHRQGRKVLADPRRANLCGADLQGTNLSGHQLQDANLSTASLKGANLANATLWNANLTSADLIGANLTKADLQGADLTNADLSGANLKGATLSNASLSMVFLRDANLSGADLINDNLREAYLVKANLAKAILWGADLTNADLSGADLSGADLTRADLTNADLSGTDLSGAKLKEADLTRADLKDANLNRVNFQAKPLPEADAIAYAKYLELMRYEDSPAALIKLRQVFKEAGFYEQERQITYAFKHTQTMNLLRVLPARLRDEPKEEGRQQLTGLSLLLFHVRHWGQLGHWGHVRSLFEGALNYVFFDLTTRWGMAPRRALLILLALIPAFAVPYVIALRCRGVNGIWRKWSDDRIRTDLGTEKAIRLRVGWRQAFALGLYFSVLSAFNIGWRELNVGNWIQRLQGNEYTLRATGWVRTVSGGQALISVGLLALWVLTYFGRPFE